MNEVQLASLMEAMSAMTSAMRQAQQAPAPNVNVLSGFDTFDPKSESFRNYKQRLEIHFEIKRVHENRILCAKLLLQYIGAHNYELLTSLAAPKAINSLTYDEIIALMEKYFCPKKNILAEQHKFFCELQNENQTITEFVAQLRKRAAESDFVCKCKASVADIFLRIQFIRGLRDDNMREQLLQNSEENFDKIIDKALSLEAAKISNKEIAHTSANYSETCQINQFQNKNSAKRNNVHQNYKKAKDSKVNYKQLGLEGLCIRCGRNNHNASECKVNKNNLRCNACNKTGHVKKVCIQERLKSNSKRFNKNCQDTNAIVFNIEEEHMGINKIIDIFQKSSGGISAANKFYTTISIEGKQQRFEVDSGAGYTLLPEDEFIKLNLQKQLKKSDVIFRAYSGDIFKPLGVVDVKVEYNNKKSTEQMYIVPSKHTPLLGRIWIRHLNINLQEIDELQNIPETQQSEISILAIENIMQNFSNIFQPKIGCIPNICCSLKLQRGAKPVFVKERQVPFALQEKVENELNELEQQGIISKISTSNWGSPLVVIPKPDGNVRLCVDYKIGVNPQLEPAHYPIKRIDDILNKLKNAKFFCKLDLYKAYLHVKVDEESQLIQAISTHRGTYKMHRLSFGIKVAPSEFNRILDQILDGLEGTLSYFDDIIVFGTTTNECEKRLYKLFERLQQNNLHLNQNKCEFFKSKIQYLGHEISHNEISKCKIKVEAITKMPRPQNADQVRKFLGMVTYYAKFIPKASTLTFPLRQLLQKNTKFYWSDKCEKAFENLKNEIITDRVLVPFDENLPVSLACDASPYGIAAVLSHIIEGTERPVAFISRALTSSEQNYSQLDREALAIIYAVDKFYMYLYAREFTLITDNRPLTRIFHQNAKTPAMTSARLLRYASFLQAFNYKIQHRKAEEHENVDCLSRSPVLPQSEEKTHFTDQEVTYIHDQTINQISSCSVTATTIAEETRKDPKLSKLIKELKQGIDQSEEFSIQHGVIFKNTRVYIPKALQKEVLAELHRTHIGIVKMKQLARKYCYWQQIDKDIENLVRSCESCALVKKNPPKVITHHWDEPQENFERVHIDYAGPFLNHHFFVLIDAKSKWAEIKVLKEAPTSEKTILLLENIFSTHGFPKVMVSDNATIFQSNIFKKYCENNGIFQKFIAPGHPATNGLAERHIQTLKAKLKAMQKEHSPIHIKIQEILFKYRATPLGNNQTPAQLYLGRDLRTKLDALRPIKQLKSSSTANPMVRQLSVGDRVQIQWHEQNALAWRFGYITQKFGSLHYQVKLDNGYSVKRHINQLYKSKVLMPQAEESAAEKKPIQKQQIEDIQIEWPNRNEITADIQPQASTLQQEQLLRRSERARKAPRRLINQ